MADTLFFIARTDIAGDAGEQRAFGVEDNEAEAVALGLLIAAQRPGEYAVFEGRAVVRLAKAASPVQAIPIT